MDIVLPTRFNNPNLPVLQRSGFRDSFDRPAAATLGTTDDSKAWDFFGFVPWKVTADGHATGAGGGLHAAVDALASDGTLTTVIGKVATEAADKRSGLLFRMLDRDNYLYLCPSTSNVLTLYGRIANATAFAQGISGATLTTGDTLAVTMVSTQITIKLNGTDIATRTVPELAGETLHGFYGNSASDAEFDSIEFAV